MRCVVDLTCLHAVLDSMCRDRNFPVPEILRVPLDEMALQIRLLELGKSREFLSKAIEPPSEASIKTAINNLFDLHALDEDEDLTPLGTDSLSPIANMMAESAFDQAIIWPLCQSTLALAR